MCPCPCVRCRRVLLITVRAVCVCVYVCPCVCSAAPPAPSPAPAPEAPAAAPVAATPQPAPANNGGAGFDAYLDSLLNSGPGATAPSTSNGSVGEASGADKAPAGNQAPEASAESVEAALRRQLASKFQALSMVRWVVSAGSCGLPCSLLVAAPHAAKWSGASVHHEPTGGDVHREVPNRSVGASTTRARCSTSHRRRRRHGVR